MGLLPKISFEEAVSVALNLKSTDPVQLLLFTGEERDLRKRCGLPDITTLVAEKRLDLRLYFFMMPHCWKACVLFTKSLLFSPEEVPQSYAFSGVSVPPLLAAFSCWYRVGFLEIL